MLAPYIIFRITGIKCQWRQFTAVISKQFQFELSEYSAYVKLECSDTYSVV